MVFVTRKPFQPSPMLAFKTRAYLRQPHFRCSTFGVAPGLTHKHKTWLEKLARDKLSSLLLKFVNYGQKVYVIS
jgi:hypothetical protein